MKVIAAIVLMTMVFFTFNYLISKRERGVTKRWGRRALWSILVASACVLAAFFLISLNSWKVW